MNIFDILLHVDKYLVQLTFDYGIYIYVILFIVIFCETGLVVFPFLPGDSLLFAAGAIAAIGDMNIFVLFFVLVLAAILGDILNYHIGKYIGPKAFTSDSKFLRKEYLVKAQGFYEKHGVKAIVLARFVPIVRTFAPFVAGIGSMEYRTFIKYNVFGGIGWVTLFLFAGYFFGGIPFIQKNFEFVVLAIIAISFVPVVYEFVKEKWFSNPK